MEISKKGNTPPWFNIEFFVNSDFYAIREMEETSVEFSVLLTVNSTWTKLNYWNAYKTQTSGAPEHIGTLGFVLAMFGYICFFPISMRPARLSRPASVRAAGRSSINVVGIICPGWERVNWSAMPWHPGPGIPGDNRPECTLPSWDFLFLLFVAAHT